MNAPNPARSNQAARIAHRLTCTRCRMGWYCGGLSEHDYESGEQIAALLDDETAR